MILEDIKSIELRTEFFQGGSVDWESVCQLFHSLFNAYTFDDNGVELAQQIMVDWDLFTDQSTANRVVIEVLQRPECQDVSFVYNSKVYYNQEVLEAKKAWENLKESIKKDTRFIIDISALEALDLPIIMQEALMEMENVKYYRARIADASGRKYSTEDIGMPPASEVSAGRANPVGIPYLYLSKERETCCYEVRAAYLDRLYIGTFSIDVSKRPMVVNLIPRQRSQQLTSTSDATKILRSRFLLNAISLDLSRPMRRHDNSAVEYLPTQFICEYVRKVITDADGIMFQSSLQKDGVNIVLFNEDKVIRELVEEYVVEQINLQIKKLD